MVDSERSARAKVNEELLSGREQKHIQKLKEIRQGIVAMRRVEAEKKIKKEENI